jgi:ElaA protein
MSVTPIRWVIKAFDDLTGREVHDIMRLRVDVFVVEQRCVYPEVDGQDPQATHLLGLAGNGTLAAYARILPPHDDGPPHIGRVIVDPAYRGQHLGRHLMHHALHEVERRYGSRRSALAAQAYLVGFYGSFGYVPTGETYLWDGIPHVDMALDAP